MSHSLDEMLPPGVKLLYDRPTPQLDSGIIYVKAIDPIGKLKLKECGSFFRIVEDFDLLENEAGFRKNIDDVELEILLKKIIEYLRDKKFDITYDSKLDEIRQGLDQREREFAKHREIGNEIKINVPKNLVIPYFHRELRDYQKKPVHLMIRGANVANFSIPGSGKTTMSYATYSYLKHNSLIDQLFVVGPKASFKPWEEEFEECFKASWKKNVIRYNGNKRKKLLSKLTEYEVVLTNLETANNDENLLINSLFSGKKILMIIDESHHIKSFDENARYANSMIRMARHAAKRIILTGTPMPHGWRDLWSQFTFLYPDERLLGTRYNFDNMITESNINSTINDLIYPYWTRVSREDMKDDLPDLVSLEKEVEMEPLQEEIYRAMEITDEESGNTSSQLEIDELRRVRILRLLQCATNPGALKEADVDFELEPYVTNNIDIMEKIKNYKKVPNKIRKTVELALALTKENKNVIIWCVFRYNVRYLAELLKDEDPIVISGDIPTESNIKTGIVGRDDLIDIFKNSKGKILIATLGSIAESVSLHKDKHGEPVCQNAIYLERSFHAGQFMQSVFRLYRIGSDPDLPVKNIHVLSRFSNRNSTIDATVHQRLRERSDRMFDLLNDNSRLIPMELDSDEDEKKEAIPKLYDNEEEGQRIWKKMINEFQKRKRNK